MRRGTGPAVAVLLAFSACGGDEQEHAASGSRQAGSWLAAPPAPGAQAGTAVVPAGLGATAAPARPAGLRDADRDARELAASLADDFAALGFEVDMDQVHLEAGSRLAGAPDLDRQQDLFFPPSYFEGIHPVFRAFGAVATADPEQMRAEMLRGLSASFLAYYQWDRDALVFFDDPPLPMEDRGFLVAHELAHAWRDQTHGFDTLFGERPRTLENVRIVRCLIEGEAQLVAQAWQARKAGEPLEAIEPADVDDDLTRLLSGEQVSMVYAYGQRYLLERFRAGGWPAVASAFAAPPASTEQLLHPRKLGKDRPTAVGLPDWPDAAGPARLVHQDVAGEMALYAFLLVTGTPRAAAFHAACGWDGDRLAVYRMEDGDAAFLWRIVWDRAEDAQQFVAALQYKSIEGAVARGRVVDWVQVVPRYERPQRAGTQQVLAQAMAKVVFDQPEDAADATSTAAIEAERRADEPLEPRLSEGIWTHPRHGLRIPAPAGWVAEERNGLPLLTSASGLRGFSNNLNVVGAPAFEKDMEALETENRDQIAALPGIELEWMRREQLGGHEVLRYQFHGRVPGAPEDLQFHGLIYLQGAMQVVITATVLGREWAELRDSVLASFEGIAIDAPESF